MTTLKAARERFIDDLQIGHYGTATSVTSAGIVHAARFQNSNRPASYYLGWWGHRPTTTGTNIVKSMTTVATATLSHGADAYTDTAELYYSLTRPEWHPILYLHPLLNRALEMAWVWWRGLLTIVPNGDAESSTVGGTDSSATTTAYTTTAANIWQGKQSFKVANSGANGYHQTATFEAAAGRAFMFGCWVKVEVGTSVVLKVIDVTNSSAVLASETFAGVGQWQYVQLPGAFPSNCYQAALRFGSSGASDITYWDDLYGTWDPITRLSGPSWLTEWKTEEGEEAFRLLRVRNRIVGDGVGPGRSYDLALMSDDQYQVINNPAAANALEVELGRETYQTQMPVLIEARRPYSSFTTAPYVSADTDTNNCPLNLWVAAAKLISAQDRKAADEIERFRDEYNTYQREYQSLLKTPAPDSRGLSWVRLR